MAVIHYHYCGSIALPYAFTGQVGVDAFLIVSGYGLTISKTGGGFGAFLSKRLLRLLPAYWIALVGIVLTNRYAFNIPFPWKDTAIHFTCIHLALGGPTAFSLNMSFWYMGLIVPLYIVFYPLRARLRGASGVIWASSFCAVMALLGFLILKHGDAWGRGPQIHSGGRFASFALGCLLGSISIAGPTAAVKQITKPLAAASLAIWFFVGVNTGVLDVVIYPLGGLAIVCAAVALASIRKLQWIFLSLLAVGAISYELYLIHQYLLLDVGRQVLFPWIHNWGIWAANEFTIQACSGLVALAIAGAIAWLVHASLLGRNWKNAFGRPLRGALTFAGAISIAIGFLAVHTLGTLAQKSDAIVSYIYVTKIDPAETNTSEPFVYWGRTGQADLVYMEHGSAGNARLCIDHWGATSIQGGWFPVRTIDGQILTVRCKSSGIEVSVNDIMLVRSDTAPYAPKAKCLVGINDIGFTSCTNVARSIFSATQAPALQDSH